MKTEKHSKTHTLSKPTLTLETMQDCSAYDEKAEHAKTQLLALYALQNVEKHLS